MGLDTSIYQNVRAPEFASPLDSASKAMTLGALARQNRMGAIQEQEQNAVRAALSKNLGPDGELNRTGVLSDLAKTAPTQALSYKSQFAEMDQKQADAKQKVLADKINQMGLAAQMAMSAKDQPSYNKMLQTMQGMGLDTSHMPSQYDPGLMRQYATASLDQKQRLEAMVQGSTMDINQAKAPLERGKLAAEINKLNGDTKQQGMTVATELRRERSGLPTTKATQDISAAYNKIRLAANSPSAAGDLSLLYGYNKLLDPGSTVREGEFANAAAAGSVNDRIAGLVLRVSKGERLSPEQRADFIAQAGNLYQAQLSQQSKLDKDYERLAIKGGVNPDDVLLSYGADEAPAPGQRLAGPPGAGVPGVASANAGQPAGPVAPAGIRMMGPDGRIRLIPTDQVGEAIAAGGKKVK